MNVSQGAPILRGILIHSAGVPQVQQTPSIHSLASVWVLTPQKKKHPGTILADGSGATALVLPDGDSMPFYLPINRLPRRHL